jgi:hypothetical protein
MGGLGKTKGQTAAVHGFFVPQDQPRFRISKLLCYFASKGSTFILSYFLPRSAGKGDKDKVRKEKSRSVSQRR